MKAHSLKPFLTMSPNCKIIRADKCAIGHKEIFCYYCENLLFKLPRQLRRNHKIEDLVKDGLKVQKKIQA